MARNRSSGAQPDGQTPTPSQPKRQRLDLLLVERGLAHSREKAQAMILAGEVMLDGQKALKSGQPVGAGARIEVAEKPTYVGRGGWKMQGAIAAFGIHPSGWVCLDVGASTGGFTDCLLQHGAARVYAIDVGHNQLDWRIRSHPSVIAKEGINARHLMPDSFPELFDLIVADLSFISILLVLPVLPPLLKPAGSMVLLIKPQFEVGREQVGKGGIVKDPVLHAEVCAKVEAAVQGLGFQARIAESPILGAEGNKEFLLFAERAS